ncbi:ATP-binding protein [Phaeobacter inhibens]|uniref:ATP-binding protein n=1 Tax=Phaeobacter inhibens TaxID=221822 RepID=UPI0021A2E54C|nr:ATP-binding protein [Phaeobacter inhibens]UWR74053.1 ATP-binding protein [Phaeobacter inhibens]
MDKLNSLRSVLTQSSREFGLALGKVLSAAQPLQSEEFLKGREQQLHGIEKALYAPGRHVLIHGLRGVGKSSLAQTAAFKTARGHDPIIVSCDPSSTFKSIIKDIFDDASGRDPRVVEVVRKVEVQGGLSFLKGGASSSQTEREIPEPLSVNDAVRVIHALSDTMGERPVFVVDEFDLIQSEEVQRDFANLVKQVSDKHIEACFIFCGIAESTDALMAAHASADRYFHAVNLGRLPWEARVEIINGAAEALGISVDRNTALRIAAISDGFPFYVHFISEKLFWAVYEAKNGGLVTPDLFQDAMAEAASAMDMKLRGPWERATQKYEEASAAILYAVADGHEFKKRSSDIFEGYTGIMKQLDRTPLGRDKFNARMHRLKQTSSDCILSGTRAGWYEFTEKMIRGYVRLKADQAGVFLDPDHPAAVKLMRNE